MGIAESKTKMPMIVMGPPWLVLSMNMDGLTTQEVPGTRTGDQPAHFSINLCRADPGTSSMVKLAPALDYSLSASTALVSAARLKGRRVYDWTRRGFLKRVSVR